MPDSKSSTPVQIRLPIEVAAKARSNAERAGKTLSEYLRGILVLQLARRR